MVTPEEVSKMSGTQKRHRMPYASLVAGLVVAADLPVHEANAAQWQRAAAAQRTRTDQGVERKKRKLADEAKNHQVDRRKKYRREKVTEEFVQKVAAPKAARAAAKAAKAAATPDMIVLH